jgi:tripartite-type tricarboxylate transporter receptor subunit TctC
MVEQKAYVLVAHPALPAKNVKDLVALAKQNPGRITIASSGVGSSNHMVGELIQMTASMKFTHIPYKGSAPAMIELMGGQVDLHVDQVMSAISHIRSGKVRAIAVTTRNKRSAQLPEVPTFDESGMPGFEAMGFTGLVVPAGTPREIVARLNAAVHKVLALPAIRDYMTGLGSDVVPGTPEELAQYIREDLARWTEVVKKGGIKVE